MTDIETPRENLDILHYYAGKHNLKCHILNCEGEADCWAEIGRFALLPETAAERRVFNRTNMDYRRKSEEFCRSYGADLLMIGMCQEESRARRITLAKKGDIYKAKSRAALTCCPLSHLTAEDIWAYIFSNKLRYLKIYDDQYLDRRRIRNEHILLYNNAIIRHGIIAHYRRMYPDFFAWLDKAYNPPI